MLNSLHIHQANYRVPVTNMLNSLHIHQANYRVPVTNTLNSLHIHQANYNVHLYLTGLSFQRLLLKASSGELFNFFTGGCLSYCPTNSTKAPRELHTKLMTNIFNLLLWVIKEINDVAPLFPCSTATSNISDSMTIYMASQLAATITAITCEAKTTEMKKKRPERRKHCALAVVRQSQKFCPLQTHSRGAGRPNLISWRWSLPLPTNPVWWGSMHAIWVIVVTDPQTHTQTHNKQTHRQDRLQYTALQLASMQCNHRDKHSMGKSTFSTIAAIWTIRKTWENFSRLQKIQCCKYLHSVKVLRSKEVKTLKFGAPLYPSLTTLITLHAKLSGAVYCYRSCLFVCNGRAGSVFYHDNLKLRASIFTKLGL